MSEQMITARYDFQDKTLTEIREDDQKAIEALLMGHAVEKVAEDHLRLDDGTLMRIVPNEGGCSCGAGDYELADLNDCANIITKVEVVDEDRDPDEDGYSGEDAHAYRIFVFAEDKRINLVSVEGDDGNGYYGTGYSILVRRPSSPGGAS